MKGERLTGTKMKGTVDRVAARELFLFIQNDEQLYRQEQAIDANLRKKLKRGVFDKALAVKLFMYLADAVASKYVQGYAHAPGYYGQRQSAPRPSVDSVFNRKTRFFVAAKLFRYWMDARRDEGVRINPISRKTAQRISRYAMIAGEKTGVIVNPAKPVWNKLTHTQRMAYLWEGGLRGNAQTLRDAAKLRGEQLGPKLRAIASRGYQKLAKKRIVDTGNGGWTVYKNPRRAKVKCGPCSQPGHKPSRDWEQCEWGVCECSCQWLPQYK